MPVTTRFHYHIGELRFSLSFLTYAKIFILLDIAEALELFPGISFTKLLGKLADEEKIYPLLALFLDQETGEMLPEEEKITFLQERLTIAGFEEIAAHLLTLYPQVFQQTITDSKERRDNAKEAETKTATRTDEIDLGYYARFREELEEEVFLLARGDILKRANILQTISPEEAASSLDFLKSHASKKEAMRAETETDTEWKKRAEHAFQQFQQG